jgi:hypothetical protein
MVTPTFAAGLGVVVAAVLALHVSGTVFRYRAPDWRAPARPTAGPAGQQGGHPAAARRGRPLWTARSAPAAAAPAAGAPAATPSARRNGTGGAAPAVSYATDHAFPGGFAGHLTLTFPGGRVPGHWRLWFSYPGRHVYTVFVMGGRWQAHGGHAASVTGDGAQPLSPPGVIRVAFWVSGSPAPPAGCSFNHAACRLS